jgi:hypothetical protein
VNAVRFEEKPRPLGKRRVLPEALLVSGLIGHAYSWVRSQLLDWGRDGGSLLVAVESGPHQTAIGRSMGALTEHIGHEFRNRPVTCNVVLLDEAVPTATGLRQLMLALDLMADLGSMGLQVSAPYRLSKSV